MRPDSTTLTAILILLTAILMALFSCYTQSHEQQIFTAEARDFNFRIGYSGVTPSPGKEPRLSIWARGPYNIFSGEHFIFSFALANDDSNTTYVLSQMPEIINGKWQGGAVKISGESFKYRHNSFPTPAPFKPIAIPPSKCLWGKYHLNDSVEVSELGKYGYQLILEVSNHAGTKRRVVSNQNTFRISSVPRFASGCDEMALRGLASALEAYFVDWCSYPPTKGSPEYTSIPPALTTPISFLRPSKIDKNRRIAIYTRQDGWCIAGKGPDGDWDIVANFARIKDMSQMEEFLPYAYDPTNGINSSGDQLINSAFMRAPTGEQLKY